MNERIRSNSLGHLVHSNEGGGPRPIPRGKAENRPDEERHMISLLKSGAKNATPGDVKKRAGSCNRPGPNSNSRAFARWHSKPTTPITTTDCGRWRRRTTTRGPFWFSRSWDFSNHRLCCFASVREKCNGFSQGAGDTRARGGEGRRNYRDLSAALRDLDISNREAGDLVCCVWILCDLQ